MAGRKLQSEIDRVLKKVTEGTGEFDMILKKVYSASSSNQKDKYEQDLKKEIKKLQRYRDQLKSWIGSNDVKDKKLLIEARKQIETQMEQFKQCEKETKTKAYSKEGLLVATQKDDAKDGCRTWITKCLDSLQQQHDKVEAELESLKAKKGKKDQERIDALEHRLARYAFHTNALEKCLRMLDNDTLSAERIDEIKDVVEDYIENNADADHVEDEEIYSSIGVNDAADEGGDDGDISGDDDADDDADDEDSTPSSASATTPAASAPTPAAAPAVASAPPTPLPIPVPLPVPVPIPVPHHTPHPPPLAAQPKKHDAPRDRSNSATHGSHKEPPRPAAPPMDRTYAQTSATPPAHAHIPPGGPTFAQAALDSAKAAPAQPVTAGGRGRGKMAAAPTPAPVQTPLPVPTVVSAVTANTPSTGAAPTAAATQAGLLPRGLLRTPTNMAAPQASPALSSSTPLPSTVTASAPRVGVYPVKEEIRGTAAPQPYVPLPVPTGNAPPLAQLAQLAQNATTLSQSAGPAIAQPMPSTAPTLASALLSGLANNTSTSSSQSSRPGVAATASPVLASQPPPTVVVDKARSDSAELEDDRSDFLELDRLDYVAPPVEMSARAVEEAHTRNVQLLESALRFLPEGNDTPPPKTYAPRSPTNSPAYYPQAPLPLFENPAFFERLDTDTLFFVFYYQQGTYQQYLAARELKKQSWRFHKKYLTWFQRHEEPKQITNDFEQGTYVYFDYETGWCQRKKTEFTFEYRYLEDVDVP